MKSIENSIEQDECWGAAHLEAKNEVELHRVIDTAHRLKMKVIPYISPYYFGRPAISRNPGAGKETMPAYLNETKAAIARYHFDGVFSDGLYWDIDASYEIVRRIRELIGDDGILYIHSTSTPLKKIYCPFIDCYATYLLRGEHRQLDKQSARWKISSFNLGNAIGTFSYDTWRPSQEMIDLLLPANARMSFWVQDGTWLGLDYHLTATEKDLLTKQYFPRLKKQIQTSASDQRSFK